MSWPGATARQIAKAVRRGDATASVVVAEHLADAGTNAALHGAIHETRDGVALAEAAIVDELPDLGSLTLAGVPVAVCEHLAVAGQAARFGSEATRRPIAATDDEPVRRLRGAGAVVIATTRSSELGLWATTDDGFDPPVNTFRADRGIAGPSGGAALAVASGAVPLALGLDGPGTAGGVRTTAAANGIVGFSPEHDPAAHDDDAAAWLAGTTGILATTVGDAAEGYAAVSRALPSRLGAPPRLRIAATDRPIMPGVPGLRHPLVTCDADTVKALLEVVRTLTDVGHDTHRATPNLGPRAASASAGAWSAAAYLRSVRFDRRRLQRRTRRLVAIGEKTVQGRLYGGLLGDGVRTRNHARDWFGERGFDVLVTPALAGPPPSAGQWAARGLRDNVRASAKAAVFTAPWGLIGFPSIVIPVGVRGDGLPSAVQLVAPSGGAALLFDLAAQLVDHLKPRRYAPGLNL
ncbi:amidase [Stackebrandtia soli]|uniref:amidase n=1 Tax=Stackebrandtia soli TaxID=1892856 RepID=UPI0039E9FE48